MENLNFELNKNTIIEFDCIQKEVNFKYLIGINSKIDEKSWTKNETLLKII